MTDGPDDPESKSENSCDEAAKEAKQRELDRLEETGVHEVVAREEHSKKSSGRRRDKRLIARSTENPCRSMVDGRAGYSVLSSDASCQVTTKSH